MNQPYAPSVPPRPPATPFHGDSALTGAPSGTVALFLVLIALVGFGLIALFAARYQRAIENRIRSLVARIRAFKRTPAV